MSSYQPARERAREIADDLARFLGRRRRRGRRRRHGHVVDIENDAAADLDSDSSDDDDDDSSSSTSVSSVSSTMSWESSLPHVPPQTLVPPPAAPHRRLLAVKLTALPSLRGLSPAKRRRDASKAQQASSPGAHVTHLPPELQVLILRHLSFADIQRLRRTSRFYRLLVTRRLLSDLYGPALDSVLLSHCRLCHAHDPSRAALLYADITHPSYPYCSTCVACAAAGDRLVAGRRVSMGDLRSARVCRWCGLPVLSSAPWRQPFFHRACYSRYGGALLVFLGFWWLQLGVVAVGTALCLRYFHSDLRVVLPAALSFSLYLCSIPLSCGRNPTNDAGRTYLWSFALEFAMLGLWIAPTYIIASIVASSSASVVAGSTVATLVFSGLNLLFRLINTLGNLILATRPPLWRRKKPNLSRGARLRNPVTTSLVLLTVPRAVEQSHPPAEEEGGGRAGSLNAGRRSPGLGR